MVFFLTLEMKRDISYYTLDRDWRNARSTCVSTLFVGYYSVGVQEVKHSIYTISGEQHHLKNGK